MTGRGSRMSPKERYLRSVYLIYQVCTDVVRHYFDGLHPPTNLVKYLLDQRTKFDKEEKKIPNYQWIQLYPEVLFRADVHIKETYLVSEYDRTDLKDYKEFADCMSTIFTCLFDSVDGDQKVKVVNLSRFESGEVLAKLEITSQYNPDDSIIQSALEVPVKSGNVDASLETSPDGFTFAKQGDTYWMEIKLTKHAKVNAAALARKDTKEFRIMAKRLERILLLLFDTVPGTQSVKVEEFRNSTSDCTCATAICKLTSEKHEDEKRLEEAIRIPNSEGRLGKTLKTTCSLHGFSFKEVIVFEAQIKVKENFSTKLENSNSNEFKAFASRVQPIIKGLYDSVTGDQDVEAVTGDQDVEIVKCRKGPSDTVLVLCHIISHGNNNKEKLRNVIKREIKTESLSLSHEITADGFKFESNKCLFEITLKLAEKYSDSTELNNPKSEAFKSFKKKVQPEIQRLCDTVCDSPEIDIFRYKSSEEAHSIKFKLTSRGCSDESTIKNCIETKIQTVMLDFNLKVSKSDLAVQKVTDRVFYQVSLNVKRQFTDELKKKHSGEFNAFSKFVQTVLNTHYEKVPGKQKVNVVKCQQGQSSTVSTDVILEIISEGCADEDKLRRPIEDLITFGKLELKLKTNATDFSFKTVRGSKPVSSECFDLSLLITLLRRDSNVTDPKKGYDVLPPKDDISDGAQIATIKYYRNELAHASDTKMDEHKFDCLWSNLENAVRILGKEDKFNKAVDDASTMTLDSSTEEVLIRMVQHDRQVLQLEKDVTELYQRIEKLTKLTEEQSTRTQVKISEIKEEIRKKEEQILKNKTDIQTFHIEIHRVEQKFDEKFRVQDERNVQQDEKNKDMESGIQENRRGIEEYRRDIQQRIDTKNSSTNHSLVTTATEIPSEESNFLRLIILILEISARAVRLTFDQEFHPGHLCDTLDRIRTSLKGLQKKHIINKNQMRLLFPPTGNKPSSTNFDITLMICLISNMTDIQIGTGLPLPTEVSVGDDLARIRWYRNIIGHSESFINDADFNIYWGDISQALHRLGGGLFDEEIIQLQSPNSDSQHYIQVHKQLGETIEKVRSLERLANDPIPKNKKDLFKNKIKDWAKTEEKFYETAATKKLLGVVKENTFTVISGNSGMGKSTTAHHIALHLQKHEDYQILPIFEPQDIVTYYVEELAQIFVIDDMCGVFNVDQHLINSWDRVSSNIQSFFKENNHVRILVTCRLQIINSPQFKKLSDKLNMKECNLLSKDFAFTYNEKKNIALYHMDIEHMRKLSRKTICSLDMFPFLCDIFGRSEDKDIKIFECPIQYFEEQFDQMKDKNEGCFLGLALLVICNDTIKTNVFTDESKGIGFKKIFKKVFESLALSNRPSKMHVLEQLNTLIDSYITINIDNNEPVITSKHDFIFDSLSFYFGKKITKTLVEYATPDFIAGRIQFESLDEEPNKYTIMIPQSLEHLYFNRMEEEILNKNFYDVFGNQQSHFKSYQEKFIDFFSKKKHIMEQLLHNRWPLYLSSMYGCSIFVQFLLDQHTPSELLQDISDKSSVEIAAKDSDTEDVDTDLDRYKITHKNAPLVIACTEGHLEIVKILVKYGYDIDVVKEDMRSPLFVACYNGHKNIVQFLLACDCKVDLEDHHCQTALHGACMKNNTDIVFLLLEKGFCINKESLNTETPLFIACKHGYPEVVNILLKHNRGIDTCNYLIEKGHEDIAEVLTSNICNVHFKNDLGRTALHEACYADHTQAINEEDDTLSNQGEGDGIQLDDHKLDNRTHDKNETFRKIIVESLLHNDVNPCIADDAGYTALHMAAESGYTTIVEVLLQKLLEMNEMALVNEDKEVDQSKSVIPPLFASSSKSVVNVFVQHNCNINVLDSHGRNALHHFSEKGYLEVVEYLYENGCKRDVLSATGRSVLHAACKGENEEIVEFILKKGCNVDHADNKDETPLFVACEGSNLKVVNILIKYNCDVNKVNVGGNNALQKVCLNGHAEIADILLKNQININQTNNSNKTPLFYACVYGYKNVVSLLVQNKCEINIPNKEGHIALHLSCLLGNIQITQLLLENHSNINQADNLKLTPLHLAAREGYSDVVKLLITNRCNMNACDSNGRNALHAACKQEDENDDPYGLKGLLECIRQETCHKDVVALLLESQCDANQRDNLGQMPLHLACEKSIYKYKKCIPDIVKLLLESGSDINKCDNSHRSPLLIACENGDRSEEIVKVLLDKNCDINIKDVNGQTALEICKSKGYTSIAGNLVQSQNL